MPASATSTCSEAQIMPLSKVLDMVTLRTQEATQHPPGKRSEHRLPATRRDRPQGGEVSVKCRCPRASEPDSK
eukprot:1195165-Prorocentrum_minimum.AAC.3